MTCNHHWTWGVGQGKCAVFCVHCKEVKARDIQPYEAKILLRKLKEAA